MHTITIPEALYSRVQEEAADTGMSVTAFVLELIEEAVRPQPIDLASKFTPEVIAHLDEVRKEADEKGWLSEADVTEHLEKTKREWLSHRG